jgi:hypothetical protein
LPISPFPPFGFPAVLFTGLFDSRRDLFFCCISIA